MLLCHDAGQGWNRLCEVDDLTYTLARITEAIAKPDRDAFRQTLEAVATQGDSGRTRRPRPAALGGDHFAAGGADRIAPSVAWWLIRPRGEGYGLPRETWSAHPVLLDPSDRDVWPIGRGQSIGRSKQSFGGLG